MTPTATRRRLAARLARNLVVTLAVTSIFALKGLETRPMPVEYMTLASR